MATVLLCLAAAGLVSLATAWQLRTAVRIEGARTRAALASLQAAVLEVTAAQHGELCARHQALHGVVEQVHAKQQFGARGPVK